MQSSLSSLPVPLPRFFPFRDKHLHSRLGLDVSGSFGSVSFMQLHDVALTCVALKTPLHSPEAALCFMNEMLAVVGISPSLNIVHTLGFYCSGVSPAPCGIVMIRYDCTLHSFLMNGGHIQSDPGDSPVGHRDHARPSTWHALDILHLLVGVADGLKHIHACGFLHNDLSVGNIFVARGIHTHTHTHKGIDTDPDTRFRNTENNRSLPEAVIGDFGRARPTNNGPHAPEPITLRAPWLARHTHLETHLSTASDVFSLGTVILSALGGVDTDVDIHTLGTRTNPDGLEEPSRQIRASLASYPTLMRVLMIQLMRIVHSCTHERPACRPSAAQAHEMLWHLTNDLFGCLV